MKTSFNGLHNKYYQGTVILRMMNGDEKKMKEWHEDYINHLYIHRYVEPTTRDYKVADMWGKGMLVREISQKMKMKQNDVSTSLRRVAMHELRKSYN